MKRIMFVSAAAAIMLTGCNSSINNNTDDILPEESSVTLAQNMQFNEAGTGDEETAPTDSEGHYISPSGFVLDPELGVPEVDDLLFNTAFFIRTAPDGANFYGVCYKGENDDNPFPVEAPQIVIIEKNGQVYEIDTQWCWLTSFEEIYIGDYDHDGSLEYATNGPGPDEYGVRGYSFKIFKKIENGYTAYDLNYSDLFDELELTAVPDEDGNGAEMKLNKIAEPFHAKGIAYANFKAIYLDYCYKCTPEGDDLRLEIAPIFIGKYSQYRPNNSSTVVAKGKITADITFSGDGFTWDNFTQEYDVMPYYSLNTENGEYTLEYITADKKETVKTGSYYVSEDGSTGVPFLSSGPVMMDEYTVMLTVFYGGTPFYFDYYTEGWFGEDTPRAVAEMYGFLAEDIDGVPAAYSVDIDGDGIKEVVSNCMSGGDGVKDVEIFRLIDNDVYSANVSYYSLFPEYDFHGADRPDVTYDPDKNALLCSFTYDDPNDRSTVHEYPIELDSLKFEKYDIAVQ